MKTVSTAALLAAFLLFFAVGVTGCIGGRAESVRPTVVPLPPPVSPSTVRFRDVARAAGLAYRWPSDGPRPRTILQTMGYGCAFLDFDRDGNLDILLVGPKLALYRGDGKGRFADVTQKTGLDKIHGQFFGCAIGDYDNDGFPDIYLTAYRGGILLHNGSQTSNPKSKIPDPKFVDVTKRVGLTPQPWGTSCAWADIDGDGYLDLLICNYVDYDKTMVQLCKQKDVLTACPPQTYKPLFPAIFRNVAGGRFKDATHGFLSAASNGNNLGIALADSEGTGRLDIALANDLRPGDLYRRPSKGDSVAFANIGASSGTATDGTGGLHAGMGVDWGDADRDGKLDLFVTTFSKETKCLYRNLGDGIFEEDSYSVGIATPTWNYVAFGCKFLDADNDGWLDLIITNGHTSDNVHDFSPAAYRQPLQFFRNAARRPLLFTDETTTFAAGKPFPAIVGRGLAIGDYDNDGRIDVLVVDAQGSPLLLHNETPNAGNYLMLDLIGGERSNRDAYGARVTVVSETGEKTVLERNPNGSYLSSSDPRLHIGLGIATKADITIRWPDGRRQTWAGLSANNSYRLKEIASTHNSASR